MSRKSVHVFSGIGLGLLLGICIGLSKSPVVAIVLTALTSLLAAYFGLKPSNEQAEQSNERLLTMGTFSFACVLAILASLFVRVNGFLSPAPGRLIKELEALNFSPEEARAVYLYKEYGIVPRGAQVVDKPLASQDQPELLYAAEVEQKTFEKLQRGPYASVEEQLTAFRNRGGKYKQYADTLSLFVQNPREQQAIIRNTLNLFLK